MNIVQFLIVLLLYSVTNLGLDSLIVIEAVELATEQIQLLKPDANGTLNFNNGGDIDVFSLQPGCLKRWELDSVKLRWDNSKPAVRLDKLVYLELVWCQLNPNSMTFSESLTSILVRDTQFINGTMADLLKSATNLQYLDIDDRNEVDFSKLFSPSVQFLRKAGF